jgi:hypothetical protein
MSPIHLPRMWTRLLVPTRSTVQNPRSFPSLRSVRGDLGREAVGGAIAKTYAFVHGELFDPLGMTTAEPGTFIRSSFMLASAR